MGADKKVSAGSASLHASPILLVDPEIAAAPEAVLWASTLAATGAMAIGLRLMTDYLEVIGPFANSVATLLTLAWLVATFVLTLRYAEFLFKKSQRDYVRRRDWALPWTLLVSGVTACALGLWLFGQNNLPALLTTDIVFTVVVIGTATVIVAMPFVTGGLLLSDRPPLARNIGKFATGLWHALLQLLVPFVLVRRGGAWSWILALLVVVAASQVGVVIIKRNRPLLLAAAWIAYGVLLLALPWLTTNAEPLFRYEHWNGLQGLAPAAVAAAIGAMMACSLLGWYLAVCFMFNGHNNEVGGASQLQDFKGFLRICVRDAGLTVYAIGIDCPEQTATKLQAKIIDVFTLRTKPAAS